MNTSDPFSLLAKIVAIFDSTNIEYVLGGSLASSMVGEPRATMDIDMAAQINSEQLQAFYLAVKDDFYIPLAFAEEAVRSKSSFNIVSNQTSYKVDIFVLGKNRLDSNQLKRRIKATLPGEATSIWVTSPEDQIVRKLSWFKLGGRVSDRQWRDVLSIISSQNDQLDYTYLNETAQSEGLSELLALALEEAENL